MKALEFLLRPDINRIQRLRFLLFNAAIAEEWMVVVNSILSEHDLVGYWALGLCPWRLRECNFHQRQIPMAIRSSV